MSRGIHSPAEAELQGHQPRAEKSNPSAQTAKPDAGSIAHCQPASRGCRFSFHGFCYAAQPKAEDKLSSNSPELYWLGVSPK